MKRKKYKKIIKLIALILMTLLVLVPLVKIGHYTIEHNYSLARILPVSQKTKARAFWLSLDTNKLEKLKQSNKIGAFHISSNNINIATADNGYGYSFLLTKHSTSLPHVSIRSYYDTPDGNKARIDFDTDGSVVKDPFNFKNSSVESISEDYREISDEEVNQLTKKGLELYNQFIEDYNNL